jgi:RNA polymerase sigma-70 factor (ECF subfamily)
MARTTTHPTSTHLLEGLLRGGQETLWSEFDARYRPIILGVCRHLGLDEHGAADVAQETLAQFLRDYRAGKYDRQRGRLRAWIIGIARHRLAEAFRQQARRPAAASGPALDHVPDEEHMTSVWTIESERHILRHALRLLGETTRTEPATLTAFEMVALRGVPAEAVAERCGIAVAEVYRIKHRLTRRLRDIVAEITLAYEGDA